MLSFPYKSCLKRKFIASGFSAVFVAGMFSSCAQAMEKLDCKPLLVNSNEVKTLDDYFNERKGEFLKRVPDIGSIQKRFFSEFPFKNRRKKYCGHESLLKFIYTQFKTINKLEGSSGFDDNVKEKLERRFTKEAIESWIEWFFPISFCDALGINGFSEVFYDYETENFRITVFIGENWEEINSIFPSQKQLDDMVCEAYGLNEEELSNLRKITPEDAKLLKFNVGGEEFDVKTFLSRRNFIFQYFKFYAAKTSLGMDEALRRLSSKEETVDSKVIKEFFDSFSIFTDLVENVTGRPVKFTYPDVRNLEGGDDLLERMEARNFGQESVRRCRISKKVIIYVVLFILISAVVGVPIYSSVNSGNEQEKNPNDAKPSDSQSDQGEADQDSAFIKHNENQTEQGSSTIVKVAKVAAPVGIAGVSLPGVALLGKKMLDSGASKKAEPGNIKEVGNSGPDFVFVGPESNKRAGCGNVSNVNKTNFAKKGSTDTSKKADDS